MKCFKAPREFLRDLMDAMGEGVEETELRGCVTWVGKDSGRVELSCSALSRNQNGRAQKKWPKLACG